MRTVLAIKQYQDLQLSCPRTRTLAQSEGPKHMSDSPKLVLPRSDLDVLMTTLDVDVIGLIECLVSPGWRLSFGNVDAPAIHYTIFPGPDEWSWVVSPHFLWCLTPLSSHRPRSRFTSRSMTAQRSRQ